MVPYQIYQALTDQRTHELVAAAKRHELLVAARHDSTDATEPTWPLKHATAQLAALLHVPGGAGARCAVTLAPGGGPIGCAS
jgi:hypothetical protein